MSMYWLYHYYLHKPIYTYRNPPPKKKSEGWKEWLKYWLLVKKNVVKKSGKKFKSRQFVNQVKGIIRHPDIKTVWAYTFYEDNSYVECSLCKQHFLY